jgi:hypothetical protein
VGNVLPILKDGGSGTRVHLQRAILQLHGDAPFARGAEYEESESTRDANLDVLAAVRTQDPAHEFAIGVVPTYVAERAPSVCVVNAEGIPEEAFWRPLHVYYSARWAEHPLTTKLGNLVQQGIDGGDNPGGWRTSVTAPEFLDETPEARMAFTIVQMLEARSRFAPDDSQERALAASNTILEEIMECRHAPTLSRWMAQAVTQTSADRVVSGSCPPPD